MSYEWVTKAGNVQDDDDAVKRTVRRIFIADLLFEPKLKPIVPPTPCQGFLHQQIAQNRECFDWKR